MASMGSILTGNIRLTSHLKALRQLMGPKKGSPIAVGANAESPKSWLDVKAIAPLLDLINLITYDMAYGTQYFNANLYDSNAGLLLLPLSMKFAWGRHCCPLL
ncbi:chitinase [Salmonella bongori]|nr:chitinase [Salmonella bongori]